MLNAQIRAVQSMKQAAMGLSAACVERLRVPKELLPVVGFYNSTLLDQEPEPDFANLLAKMP